MCLTSNNEGLDPFCRPTSPVHAHGSYRSNRKQSCGYFVICMYIFVNALPPLLLLWLTCTVQALSCICRCLTWDPSIAHYYRYRLNIPSFYTSLFLLSGFLFCPSFVKSEDEGVRRTVQAYIIQTDLLRQDPVPACSLIDKPGSAT